jgi:hypothetical protein
MEFCKKCIVPDSFPGIAFNSEGICSFCLQHEKKPNLNDRVKGEEELRKIAVKTTGNYDVAVPLSGGKDSSYVLYYVVQVLKLKPLALSFNNGFVNPIAVRNVQKLCQSFGVDLITGKATQHRQLLVKEALKTSRHLGRFIGICRNCENNLRSFAIHEASKYKIPLIIWGNTDFEDGAANVLTEKSLSFREQFGKSKNISNRAKNILQRIMRDSGGMINTMKVALHETKCAYHGIRDNLAQKSPEGLKALSPFMEVSLEGKNTRSISLFDYIAYSPFEMIETLKTSVGWESPSDNEARMDCKIHAISNYQHLKDTGITKDGFTLSVLVRNELLPRDEAMRREKAMQEGLEKEVEQFCKAAGVPMNVLNAQRVSEMNIPFKRGHHLN